MDERILINPDNRFLAGSGANDFSLYGAPSDPSLAFRAAEPDGGGLDRDVPQGGGASRDGGDPPSHDIQQSALPASDASGPAWGSAAVAARAPDPAPAAQTPVADGSPGAASALAPAAFGLTAPLAPSPAAADAAPVAPVSTAMQDQALVQIAQVAQVAQAEQAEPLAAAVSGPLASLSIDEAVGRATDDVQDLLGTDPTAGIATLVSLVSISDVVDLGDVGAETPDVVVAPIDTMLDALAADPAGAFAPESDEDGADESAGAGLLGAAPLPDDPGDLPFGLG
ncbi:MAG TPA: hypothetical protein VGB79_05530 [Allosphingosinicella sp.]|jgi:hypothetical protein